MFDDDFSTGVNLRNIDILNSMAIIATNNLTQFYRRELLAADYCHLFTEYFENVFFDDVDSHFIPLLQKGERADISVFFIKCSFFLKESKARKPILVSDLYDDIVKRVGTFLYNENLFNVDSEILIALSDFYLDFISIVNLESYFDGLKEKYDQGFLVSVPEPIQNNKKLKTNLSVPQLVLLFRSLNEIKPSIFEVKHKKELVDFIVTNFETKGTSSLKPDSIGNKFSEFDQNARDFWLKHISTIQKFILDLKEK
jgi:hypothetical protein